MDDVQGLIFDIDTFAVHDGPGIRMAVYLKGCPLECAWCHSPESQGRLRETILVRDRCVVCGACVVACPEAVHRVDGGKHALERARCRACGACVEACPNGALQIKGYGISAREVVTRATRMKPFFEPSGGGITLTGGEVSGQPEFAAAVLAGCRAEGIHTAIETCGACSWPRLKALADLCDLVLYDLKLIDEEQHRRWTGASNRTILENAGHLAAYHVQIRVPLIPGITDTHENLTGIYAFMRQAGLKRVALLPYNPSAGAKYEWLDRRYELEGTVQDPDYLEHLADLGQAQGLEVSLD
jgi:pyruvate formate lyase activating enzyme